MSSYRIKEGENWVEENTSDRVSVSRKAKTLRKFGRNTNIGTSFETVWQVGGDETYATTNAIDKFSSSNAGDTQEIVIEGHTINSSGELSFVSQTVTLAGQTETALTTPLARCTRLYNNSSTDFAGTIYVYEDDTVTAGVPQTTSKIHLQVTEGNQSEKASTSISNNDYYFITQFTGYCFTKAASAIIEFIGEMREVGTTNKAWKRVFSSTARGGEVITESFDPVFIVPKNYDIRVRAKADASNRDVGCAFNGYLATII